MVKLWGLNVFVPTLKIFLNVYRTMLKCRYMPQSLCIVKKKKMALENSISVLGRKKTNTCTLMRLFYFLYQRQMQLIWRTASLSKVLHSLHDTVLNVWKKKEKKRKNLKVRVRDLTELWILFLFGSNYLQKEHSYIQILFCCSSSSLP